MILVAIIAAEIAFWAFLLGGLALRYAARMPRTGLVFLVLTPVVDLVLLALTAVDLARGADVTFVHGLSAFYIGYSVMLGPRIIAAMDRKFAQRYGKELPPGPDPSSVPEQDALFRRVCLASALSVLLLVAGILLVGRENSFWLIYWIVVMAFIPAVWWFTGPRRARRRAAQNA